jgi:deazaflavin-dependent oxidoreductase (nitroreductase family)
MVMPRPLQHLVQHMAASDAVAKVAPPIVVPLDRFLHRISGGRILLSRPAIPSILLTTTGARSGRPRSSPLAAVRLDGVHHVVASNFGGQHHPAWSYNLLAHPQAKMSFDAHEVAVRAELLPPEEKDAVWPRLVEIWPPYERYAERSGRDLRVFRLVPLTPGCPEPRSTRQA